jgi:hypothetical protein
MRRYRWRKLTDEYRIWSGTISLGIFVFCAGCLGVRGTLCVDAGAVVSWASPHETERVLSLNLL